MAAAGFVLSFLYARAARKRTAERIGHSVPCLALLMEPDPYTMPADSTVSQVMRAFVDLKVSGLPLVDAAGHPVGFVSDGDVMRYLADRHPVVTGAYSLMKAANDQGIDERLRELMLLPARTIATEKLIALDADATLEEACSLLASRRLKKVPVVSEGLVAGTVNRSDVLRYAMDTVLQAAPVR